MTDQQVRRAYLHIGAPKTGSTFLQGVLWNNRDALLSEGVHMLGDDQGQHYRAGKDLRGIPFDPADPGVDWTGAWGRMVKRAAESASPAIVVSDEHLAALDAGMVERAVATLAPREVHVVYTTRDLPGLMPSEWQEFVKHGSTHTYPEWAAQVLADPAIGPGVWFWKVHDVVDIVRRWQTQLPAERIHVITMPPREAAPDELWRRMARVLEVDASVAHDLEAPANTALGSDAAEVLRRLNEALPEEFPTWHKTGVVRDVVANRILNPLSTGGRPGLPGGLARAVLDRATATVEALPSLGCDLVGDIAEIAPDEAKLVADPAPSETALLDVATAALAGTAQYAAEVKDELVHEREQNRRAREQMVLDHEAHVQQVLAEQDAAFWEQHKMARRIQTAKERVVAAEESSAVIASGMNAFRRARRLGQD